jgi:hypothetical protein
VLAGEYFGDISFNSCVFVENLNDDNCDVNKGRGAIVLWVVVDSSSEVKSTHGLTINDSSFYKNHATADENCTSMLII